MEWTWLKDWWRLKRYRLQHRTRKNHHSTPPNVISATHQYDNSSKNVSVFEENDNEKFINDGNNDKHVVMKQKRRKRRGRKEHVTIAYDGSKDNNALYCDEGVLNDTDIDITFESDIEEVNDFCYCDDCLNVRFNICVIYLIS